MRYLSFKLLNCTSSLYILHTRPLSDTYIICKYMYHLFFKFDLCHFIVSVLAFGDWRNPKRIFTFTKKGKGKNNIPCSFTTVMEKMCIPSSPRGTAKFLPQQLHTASWHQAAWVWTVSVIICALSFSLKCSWFTMCQ